MRRFVMEEPILFLKNRAKNPAVTNTWAIIRISLLVFLLQLHSAFSEETNTAVEKDSKLSHVENSNASSEELTWTFCGTKRLSFIDVVLDANFSTSGSMGVGEECLLRPKCDETTGCNAPLHCFDFSKLENGSSQFSESRVVVVSPHQLESIVEDSAVQNVCAIVLFYAPWCTFSAQFARKFNALGRSFRGLPILALNLAESEPHKYILAYLPLVAFYYRGKTLFKFSLESSFEDLRDTVSNITGSEALPVNLSDPENEGPIRTERETSDQVFLAISVWWVAFVGLVYAMKSQQLRQWYLSCLRTTSRQE
jgi:thiol-disulfide isomerase/thioredoxin